MAKIEILIEADARDAVSQIGGTTDSLNKLRKEQAAAQNDFASTGQGVDRLTKATEEYVAKLSRTINAMGLSGESLSTLRKQYNLLANEQEKLMAMSPSNDVFSMMSSAMADIEERMDAMRKLADEEARLSKERAENRRIEEASEKDKAQIAYYTLIGNSIGKARAELQSYGRVLQETIKKEGASSEAARKAAEEYKRQEQQLQKLEKTTRNTSLSMGKLIASWVSAEAIAWASSAAMRFLTSSLGEMADASARAEETANLFSSTFSNIRGEANNLVTTFSSRLGLAVSTSQEMLGLFGDLAIGYGQTESAALEFAKAAAETTLDIISFKNISDDTITTMQNFASGLVGNYENFRRYGYVITAAEVQQRLMAKGMDKLSGESLQFAKIQETLAIIQEKSVNAQGDMVKTLDSTANIARRVDEANKQLSETLGSSINRVLNPLRLIWLDIAENINKATLAQSEFAKGSKDIQVYDIRTNKSDQEAFRTAATRMDGVQKGTSLAMQSEGYGYMAFDTEGFSDSVYELMTVFHADTWDVIKAMQDMGVYISDGAMETIREVGKLVSEERNSAREAESRRSLLEDAISSAQGFVDALSSISGVSVGGASPAIYQTGLDAYSQSDDTTRKVLSFVESDISEAIRNAISSLTEADWKTFADPLELALGTVTENDALEKQLEAAKELYEAVSNRYILENDGTALTDEQIKNLEDIKTLYADIAEEIETITENEERRKSFEASLSAISGIGEKAATDSALVGRSALGKDLSSLEGKYQDALPFATTAEEITALNEAFATARENVINFGLATAENTLDEQMTRLFAKEGVAPNYEMPGAGNAEMQAIYNDIMERGIEIIDKYTKTLEDAGLSQEQITAKTDIAMQQLSANAYAAAQQLNDDEMQKTLDEFLSNISGGISDIVTAVQQQQEGQSAPSSLFGAIFQFLWKIVASFEIVQRLLNMISDILTPVFDAFFKPMLPILDTLVSICQILLVGVLEPLFFMLKPALIKITLILGLIDIVINFINDCVRWLLAKIWNGIVDIIDALAFWTDLSSWKIEVESPVDNAKKRWDALMVTLGEISGSTMGIEENTEDSSVDLSVYEDLRNKGIIDANEFQAMVASAMGNLPYDHVNANRVSDSSYVDYNTGAVTYSSSNIVININGSGLTEEELQRTMVRTLGELGMGDQIKSRKYY